MGRARRVARAEQLTVDCFSARQRVLADVGRQPQVLLGKRRENEQNRIARIARARQMIQNTSGARMMVALAPLQSARLM